MNRRTFIGTSAVAGVAIATVGAKCGGPSVQTEVGIAQASIGALKVIFPSAAPTLEKAAKLFSDFNSDWVAGQFDSAQTVFDSLDTLVSQVINDLGINGSDRAKFILVTLGATLRAVAALIKEHGNQNPVAARRASATAPQTVNRVSELADPAAADRLLKAVKQ